MSTRRGFLGRLLGGTVGIVGAAALGSDVSAAPVVPAQPALPTPSTGMIAWPCASCGKPQETPALVFPSVKFDLRCNACGAIQPYLWHIKAFDPNPTEYGTRMSASWQTISPRRPQATGSFVSEESTQRRTNWINRPQVFPLKDRIKARLARPRRVLPLPL